MADTRDNRSSGRRGNSRASQACVRCRQRKIKCNGLAPGQACESCTSLQVSCTVGESDGRKYIHHICFDDCGKRSDETVYRHGSRAHFDALQARIRRLESALAQQAQLPDNEPQDNSTAPTNVPPEDRPTTPVNSLDDVSEFYQANDDGDVSFYPDEMVVEEGMNVTSIAALASPVSNRAHNSPRSGRVTTTEIQQQAKTQTHPLQPFDMPPTQLTPASEQDDHLDMILPDGQPRFYGPTSQRYLKDHDLQPFEDLEPRTASVSSLKLDAAPRKDFLFQIFFRTQLLSTAVVQQTPFEAGRVLGTRSQRYSRFLESAILACASRMSTSHDLRQSGSRYADRAKQEILEEISNPNIATLQGLLLLSDFEATRGRNRLGYIYCGIACRLVFDLGLTASCTTLVAEGKLSKSEAIERHDLLLAAHVFDKLWSIYMGRPSAIPTAMVAAAHQRLVTGGWKGSSTAEHWVGLCTDLSDATELLLTTSSIGPTTVDCLKALDRRLKQRFDSLPKDLAVTDLDQAFQLSPSAYALNIQFHGAQIVLRGLLKRAIDSIRPGTQTSIRRGSQHGNSGMEQPCQEMLDNAIAIARLVSTYHDTFGVENIVTIMLDNMYVASAVLVSHVLHDHTSPLQDSEASPRSWLETLRSILHKARVHYPVAARMCLTLSKTVSGTILSGMYDDPATTSSRHMRSGNMGSELSSALYTSNPRLDGSFDNDPMLGNIFAEELTMDAGGNLMDWLALGLETDKNTMPNA